MSTLTTATPTTRRSTLKRGAAVLLVAGGLTAGAAVPASAAPTNDQRGLVNANLQDISVQVPVSVAAAICGVNVAVLAQGLANGPVDCDANGEATATRDPGGSDAQNRQRGLVNVNIQDLDVQVPAAIAADVCGVTVSVLAAALANGPVTCNAEGISTAEA